MCRLVGLVIFLGLSFVESGYCQEVARYDLIIHEIYADPTPSHGLPTSEFLEIRNVSNRDIDLKNFIISNGNTSGKIIYTTILRPDSLIILCSTSSLSAYSAFGRTQSVSGFPSLSNDQDTISIISPNGQTLHAVNYDLSWYNDAFKQEGGWSLEMIQTDKACLGKENWSSSIQSIGGSPGKINSIMNQNIALSPIQLSYAFMEDSITIKMIFNKSLAPLSNEMELHLDEHSLVNIGLEPPLYNILSATLQNPIQDIKSFDITLNHGRDCLGNAFNTTTQVALFSKPENNNEIINEILFNPDTGGYDYLELLNTTDKTFDLSNFYLANRNSSEKITSITKITDEHWPLSPNSFIVFTEDCYWLKQKFKTDSTCWCFTIDQMPSYPDEKGTVLILNENGKLLDELNYDENWHNKLVFNKEGVALERITPFVKTNDPLNWYSASSQSGYGTPGYRNSQNKTNDLANNLIELSNPIVSPDNDGRDDFVLLKYQFPLNGYIANIWITDAKGQMMKILARNELCGITGQFRWDGLDSKGNRVMPGNYIIIMELFHLSGSVKRIHKTISVYY